MTDRIRTITMPKWGMTMTEGKVAAWLKAEGEAVAPGEEFVEIETDKIANAVEAEAGGTLRRILVRPGESAPCGAPIALMADEGVAEAEIEAAAQAARSAAPEAEADTAPQARRVEAGDLSLNVVSAGGGDAPPVVLLHGFGSDAGAWMFVQAPLAEGRAVHAVELPSHGESDVRPLCAGLDDLAAAVGAAIDAVAPGRLHLVGHSLGGRLALRLAARWGDRVASLALIAPAGLGAAVSREFLDAFLAADRRRPMKEALRMLVADEGAVRSEMVERALQMKRADGVPEALAAIRAASLDGEAASEGAEADLAEATAGVLLIRGAEDRVIPLTPPPDGRAGLAVVDLTGVGHMPQMETPARVADLLRAHVEAAS